NKISLKLENFNCISFFSLILSLNSIISLNLSPKVVQIRLLYQGTTEIVFTMWNDVLTAVKKYKNVELDAKITKLRMLAPMLGMHEYFHPY
ncbi:hypothetical protein KSS87_023643, partial [Heliosperma pusillum]